MEDPYLCTRVPAKKIYVLVTEMFEFKYCENFNLASHATSGGHAWSKRPPLEASIVVTDACRQHTPAATAHLLQVTDELIHLLSL
jgi:hypothetical protein